MQHYLLPFPFILAICLSITSFVLGESKIGIVEQDHIIFYDSLPAKFGKKIQNDIIYLAILPDEDTYLCDDVQSNTRKMEFNPNGNFVHGKKFAILVKRGNCTFEKKARNAMKWNQRNQRSLDEFYSDPSEQLDVEEFLKYSTIDYIIIYDNRTGLESELITMGYDEDSADDISVSLLFVKTSAGKALLSKINSSYPYPPKMLVDSTSTKRVYDQNQKRKNPFSGEAALSFYIIFYMGACLFSLPIIHLLITWYATGGRINIVRRGMRLNIIMVRAFPAGPDSHPVYRRMTARAVRALPEIEYHGDVDGRVTHTCCSICLDDYEEGEKVRILKPCGHIFHTNCVLPWLTERQGCCPLCKSVVGVEILLLDDEPALEENESVIQQPQIESSPSVHVRMTLDGVPTLMESEPERVERIEESSEQTAIELLPPGQVRVSLDGMPTLMGNEHVRDERIEESSGQPQISLLGLDQFGIVRDRVPTLEENETGRTEKVEESKSQIELVPSDQAVILLGGAPASEKEESGRVEILEEPSEQAQIDLVNAGNAEPSLDRLPTLEEDEVGKATKIEESREQP